MPKLDLSRVPAVTGSDYPEPHATAMGERWFQALGDAAGLTRFGVSRVRLAPGATSSLRHWHPDEDEFAIVLEGELILVDDAGEQPLRPGDCIGWPAGDENGHHILNRSQADGVFIVVGSRPERDCFYSDVDLVFRNDAAGGRYETRDGTPVPPREGD
ncbi:cupin domain-containing protein [Albimonas sp. CAU 1670]|uniref:cupin domain-containing protein n=1 Tax=Albimonas sp. CAU 1670 TaxID=3032599 RepID=UPI0023DBA131|nr:cupin domain-containing protein [Albimonas sp. CAU 1670]MDF2231170.1 cupin domain-containing protein [Albimonas sp. CAU 1670]